MFDKDTLIVTYDEERGEPRGARSRKADLATLNLGACVDCSLLDSRDIGSNNFAHAVQSAKVFS